MGLFSFNQPGIRKAARRELTKEDVLLAERIKRLRRERGLTQAELSDLLGMNASYITQVEAKQQGLSLPMVYRLAKIFHLSLQECSQDKTRTISQFSDSDFLVPAEFRYGIVFRQVSGGFCGIRGWCRDLCILRRGKRGL